VEKAVVVVSATQPQDVLSGRGGGREKNANPAFREFGQTRIKEIRQSRGEDAPITDRDRKEIVDDWLRDHPDCWFLKRVWIDAGREEGERKIKELALDLNRSAKKKKKKKIDQVQDDDGSTTEETQQGKETSRAPHGAAAPSSSTCDSFRSDKFAPDLQQDMVDSGEPMFCKRPKLDHDMESDHEGHNHPAGTSDTSLNVHHDSIGGEDGVFADLAVVPTTEEARTVVEGPLDGWDFAPELFDDIEFLYEVPEPPVALNPYIYLTYDAMTALGLAACAVPNGLFSGKELYDQLRKTEFDGVTGLVRFDPTTSTRRDKFKFEVKNLIVSAEHEFRSATSCIINFSNKTLDTRVEIHDLFMFPGGATTPVPPAALPPPVHVALDVELGVVIVGNILAALVMVTSVGWMYWTWRNQVKNVSVRCAFRERLSLLHPLCYWPGGLETKVFWV
jgi:hypothetical protein